MSITPYVPVLTPPHHVGWTPVVLLGELLESVTAVINGTAHYEWEVEFPAVWIPYLDMDYYPFPVRPDPAHPYRCLSLRQRLMECPHIKKVSNVRGTTFTAIIKPLGEVK
jgi:hypothetical protein